MRTNFSIALAGFSLKDSKFLNVDIQNALAIAGYPLRKRNISITNDNSTQIQ